MIDILCYRFHFIGGHSREAPTVLTPNTEVKLFDADVTEWVARWESRHRLFLIAPHWDITGREECVVQNNHISSPKNFFS